MLQEMIDTHAGTQDLDSIEKSALTDFCKNAEQG